MDNLVATSARQAEAWLEREALVDALHAAVHAELRRMRVDVGGFKDQMRGIRLKGPRATARNRSSGLDEGRREAKSQGAASRASGAVFVCDACCQTSARDVESQVLAHSVLLHQESALPSTQQAAKCAAAAPSHPLPSSMPQLKPSTPYPAIDRMLLRKHRLLGIAQARHAGRAEQPAVHGDEQVVHLRTVHMGGTGTDRVAGSSGAAGPPSFDPAPGALCERLPSVRDLGQGRNPGGHCASSGQGHAGSSTSRPVSNAALEQGGRQAQQAGMCQHTSYAGSPERRLQQDQECRRQGRARPALVWDSGARPTGGAQQAHAPKQQQYAALASWRGQRMAAATCIQAAVRGYLCRLRLREETLVTDAAAALGMGMAQRCFSGWMRVATLRKRLAFHLERGLARRGFRGKQILKEDGKYAYAAAWCNFRRSVKVFEALILSAVDPCEGSSSCPDDVHGS
ncbi:hypothetical protein DUNSADRAFT_17438 [Dunaliella salina]|uniref:Uncharacterized protein n=1 Tax=Dunaliella salina TaxID=3046 RepID=A0ABQ7H035_DUNSA|nr:hypothetical protein DUNSADRAFT_17438 [Dunaliella salina]|eukprot:KAF5840221.1 hypothetical protein DUNSADRAFT_17438 [Dunaliella salina]